MKLSTKIVVAAFVSSLGLAGTALAGQLTPATVSITTASNMAQGSLGGARNTTDSIQFIGCATFAVPTGTTQMICYARDAFNSNVTCFSSAPALVAAVQGMTGDANVIFTWNASGVCTEVDVYSASNYAPKKL